MKEHFLSFMSISITHQCAAAIRTAEEDDWHLSDRHEGGVVSEGYGDGDVYGGVDQKARNRDRSEGQGIRTIRERAR